jgi:glucuronate isomerase
MLSVFIKDDFLLNSKSAQRLYFDYAKDQPIIDYHCHLPVQEIAENRKFENLTRIWLNGDHYKWRAMRTNGVNENFITGNASDRDKFQKWAETVPYTVRNPLYHWSHMELKRPFGISDRLLNGETAEGIWNHCIDLLKQDDFSTQGIMQQFKVEAVCTTDDPIDSLEFHKAIANSDFNIQVLPTFRPDKAMAVENLDSFLVWMKKLEEVSGISVKNYSDFIEAIRKRHNYFHLCGCRLSDHGIETAYAEDYNQSEIDAIFNKILKKLELNIHEILQFKSALMYEFGIMDFETGWVQQLHLGALRNNNSRMFRTLGPDTGWDSIGNFTEASALAKYLDRLDIQNKLTKTIIYNLNPADNELMAAMIGNFQDGTIPGKLQYGSGWWFLDQKTGMEKQMNALSNLGLLSRFVGMLTDSRSFLSYPRHDYFRRVLCNCLGDEIEKGLIPADFDLVGQMVKNISYGNARDYFRLHERKNQ